MQNEFNKLEEKIKEVCKNRPVYYLANPGNWGDGLIRYGTLKFLKDKQIPYTELSIRKKCLLKWIIPFLKGGTVIYGGGGAWCKYYYYAYSYIKKLMPRFNIIVLPSTYEYNFSVSENVTMFARDKFQSIQNMPRSIFCHDMAFYLGKIEAPKGKGTGYFFRTDVETSNKIELPQCNRDLSLEGTDNSDIYPFLAAISEYETIYTDRLHIAIAAALMGREVHLYPGSYFKIKAIYESSIKDYFKNVHYHEDISSIPLS